jgi:hypothetical protein
MTAHTNPAAPMILSRVSLIALMTTPFAFVQTDPVRPERSIINGCKLGSGPIRSP